MSKSKLILGFFAIIAILFIVFLGKIFETNYDGFYLVKQAAVTGKMSIKSDAGIMGQYFGKITRYKRLNKIFMSYDKLDGGDSDQNTGIKVRFPDGWAEVNFQGSYRLPIKEADRLKLKTDFSTAVGTEIMVKKQIIEAIENTATLMNSGAAYAELRAQFAPLARKQALEGTYASQMTKELVNNTDGSKRVKKIYSVKKVNGKPVITKPSLLAEYNIDLPEFNIVFNKFDPKLEALIEARKDAQKAQQDAITAKATGDAGIAKERAEQEIVKIKAVTIAEKEKEVAELQAEKAYKVAEFAAKEAKENAKKIEAEGKAKGYAAAQLVRAGLSPLDRARIDKETRIGVAKAIAGPNGLKLPVIWSTGAGKDRGPLETINIEYMMKLADRINSKKALK